MSPPLRLKSPDYALLHRRKPERLVRFTTLLCHPYSRTCQASQYSHNNLAAPFPNSKMSTRDYTLLTHTCLHFALLPSTSALEFDDLFETLSEPSRASSDLKHKVASSHFPIKTHCDSPECWGIIQPEWEERIYTALSSLQISLKSFKGTVLELGPVYHSIPVSTRLELADWKECALAHQIFAVEQREWETDPVFTPYRQAKKVLSQIERTLKWSVWTDAMLTEVAVKINDCRALVNKVSGYENEIVAGVKKLHALYTKSVNQKMEAINSMNEQISGEKERKREEEMQKKAAEAKLQAEKEEAERKRKAAAEEERRLIRETAAKEATKRWNPLGLFGKKPKLTLKLADSPKPKENQYIRPVAKNPGPAEETIESKKASPEHGSLADEEATPVCKASPTAKTVRKSKSKALQKKASIEAALLSTFLGRVNGF